LAQLLPGAVQLLPHELRLLLSGRQLLLQAVQGCVLLGHHRLQLLMLTLQLAAADLAAGKLW
jgi:hypothetical protein